MKRRVFMGLGVTAIAAGTLHSTGAASSITAGRGVSTSAAEDSTALVGLDIADEVESNEESELLTVTNNFTDSFEFTIELTGDATSNDFELVINGTNEGNIATESVDPGPENSQQINIDVSGGGHNEVGEDGITFDIDVVVNNNGPTVTLSRGDVTVTNPGGGGGNTDDEEVDTVPDSRFSVQEFTSSEAGILEFTLSNGGDPATFTHATINEAGDATFVGNENDPELTDGNGGEIDFKGGTTQSWMIGEKEAIEGGSDVSDETTFTIQQLQDDSDDPVSLVGETVSITLVYEDGDGSYEQQFTFAF
ncbi:hypothetical protein [Natronorubrum bangense]|uniref:60S ribosomal protein L36-like protein n=2 Tax=Natronorubrum bangense TaxID=61858 RepID=L9WHK7_9EURY|nr:hypothetical protein [Natronorubrum bangense]ELY48726.1 60S ribosomal protein L36-like protein [Natronorubrum bangense JCM 10635]QCC53883.1 hypothetical protein DV706_04885 [Natronorubrum bangense]